MERENMQFLALMPPNYNCTPLPPPTSNLNLGANGPRRQKGRCKRSIVEIFHHYSFEQYTAFLHPLPINYLRCQHNILKFEQLFFLLQKPISRSRLGG